MTKEEGILGMAAHAGVAEEGVLKEAQQLRGREEPSNGTDKVVMVGGDTEVAGRWPEAKV